MVQGWFCIECFKKPNLKSLFQIICTDNFLINNYNTYLMFGNTIARRRSDLWYILPIFGGLIGGLIAWFAVKYDDPRKGRNCLILGIILTAIPIVLISIPFFLLATTDFSMSIGEPYQPPIQFVEDFTI